MIKCNNLKTKKMQKIIPLGNKVLIKLHEKKQTYGDSGIFIPESVQEEPMTGTVMSVGEDVKTMKEGDNVRISEFGTPMSIESEGHECLLFNQQDIVAKVIDV
tara:strand:+ start:150 stop:458 length:309 start_codon:yes stop_codon:yes gene_type:complete